MRAFIFKSPIFLLLRTGWEFAGRYRLALVLCQLSFVVAQGLWLFEPYVIGQMINVVQSYEPLASNWHRIWHSLLFYLGLLLSLSIGFWLFHGPGRVVERMVAYHIKANYKLSLFKLVIGMPLQWHRDHHSGESIDKINRSSNSLFQFFDTSFDASYMVFRFLGAEIILFWFMPDIGFIAVAITLIAIATVYTFDRYLYKQYLELNKFENKVTSTIYDYVTNIVSVISLRLENHVSREVQTRLMAAWDLFNSTNKIHEFKWFMNSNFVELLIVISLGWYAYSKLSAGQVIMAGTFFMLYGYLQRINESFYKFTEIYGTIVERTADVQSAQPIIEAFNTIPHVQKGILPNNWKAINVSNLYFRYEDSKHREHHLDGVSVCLRNGRSIALVGESGSGKSTLLSLLRGIQIVDTIDVYCDDVNLPYKFGHLADSTTLIPQDPEVFADTIRFNITFGFEANESELLHVIHLARFDSVLKRLPHGLETNIAEKGINLSGGEKQRLALARGLFFAKDSQMLLLDEPTSSVDAVNERLIYTGLFEEFKDKCIVSAVHRLHLLEMFDYIYLFKDGRIVESGSFKTLIQKGGELAKMYSAYRILNNMS